MNPINLYLDITKQLIQFIHENQEIELENNEEFDETINDYLQQRQKVLVEIKPPFSEEEKEIGEILVPLEKELNGLLVSYRVQLAEELRKIQFLKRGNDKYANPYESVQPDGMFYDKKK